MQKGNFIVSARKYRPSTFAEVLGQEPITDTLKNAIKSDHLGQAFLFCGPRGVGKTSCARILAKVLNCSNKVDSSEPCNKCESCVSFNQGRSLNIYELDAASNNSVDDIRNLVEQVRYAPHEGQFKVYIIDEVHMLSSSAFNAFLKTLEEPPSYAVFILATTEKHKIIPTILSRCQIYDFSRIGIRDIVEHLQHIAEEEKIIADKQGLHFIAQKADGALRDALSIFDQLAASAGNNLSYELVLKNLNILDYEYYFKVTDALNDGDHRRLFLIFNDILQKGFDGQQFINGLSQHLRDLLVCKDKETLKLLEVSEEIRDKYGRQSAETGSADLIHWLQICNTCDINYKSAKNQRLHVEVTLLKMAGIKVQQEMRDDVPAQKKNSKSDSPSTASTGTVKVEDNQSQSPKTIDKKGPEPEMSKPKVNTQEEQATRARQPATISITERLGPKKASSEKAVQRNNKFSEDDLRNAFDEFCELKKAMKRKTLHFALTNKQSQVNEDKLLINVENMVQLRAVEEARTELQEFIANKLNSDKFSVLIEHNETNADDLKPYTAAEKFKEMAKRNPDLLELQKKFDLDFE